MALAETWNAPRTKYNGAEYPPATDGGQYAAAAKPRPLPAFLIAGPPRTGTSWLHEVLQPYAHLPALSKETRFFDLHYGRGLNWYLDHFPDVSDGRPAGEIAPTYFASAKARDRITRALPQAKLAFTFRHPVQRLVSLYRLKRAYGMVGCSLERALEMDPELIGSSRYATHLAEWQKRFPAEQIQVNLYEDLRQDPQSFVNRIADFVGIPRFRLDERFVGGRQPHASAGMTEPKCFLATRAATAMADWCKGRRLDNFVIGVRNSRLGRMLLSGGEPFAEIPRETMEKIARLLLPETEKLEALLGRDLSAWKQIAE
ncbi:MAG TPA: sulfotransferase [Acidobacteriaceae bacterium]|nr:sulfotransferase [Acidobacteriaceae bacterium]